jgi:hypothetical protein
MASKSGSSKKGRQHSAHQEKYRKQSIRTNRNKEKAREKHLNKHPQDLQAKKQIEQARRK